MEISTSCKKSPSSMPKHDCMAPTIITVKKPKPSLHYPIPTIHLFPSKTRPGHLSFTPKARMRYNEAFRTVAFILLLSSCKKDYPVDHYPLPPPPPPTVKKVLL